MSTSQTSGLSKPSGNAKISAGTFAYIRTRNRQRVYNLIIREFRKSRLSQADLARRMGKAPEVISRLLNRPRNLDIDTVSDLLFAISGAVPFIRAEYPLDGASFRPTIVTTASTGTTTTIADNEQAQSVAA